MHDFCVDVGVRVTARQSIWQLLSSYFVQLIIYYIYVVDVMSGSKMWLRGQYGFPPLKPILAFLYINRVVLCSSVQGAKYCQLHVLTTLQRVQVLSLCRL